MSEPRGPVQQGSGEPRFISYLLDPDLDYEFYFVVGNKSLMAPVERIGVVKKMLMAHSEVFRRELQDSKMAEKGDVPLTDVYPDTFKNLLKFVYGYDNITNLCFEDADNLLYTAEKYMISSLKDKVAVRLMSLLSYENICCLMNNPACYSVLELNATITKILQSETDKVMASAYFLELTPEVFLRLLQHQTMNVPEVEVWRAAVKWAKHRADSEDGPKLRKELIVPLKHIRICTLQPEDFCREVVPSRVLTDKEIRMVCSSLGTKKKQLELLDICNDIVPRIQYLTELTEYFDSFILSTVVIPETNVTLCTKDRGVELLSFGFLANRKHTRDRMNFSESGFTYQCNGSVKIFNKEDDVHHLINLNFSENVKYNEEFSVSLQQNGQNVLLAPKSKYKIRVMFGQPHPIYHFSNGPYSNDNFSVTYNDVDYDYCYDEYGIVKTHISKVVYRMVKE